MLIIAMILSFFTIFQNFDRQLKKSKTRGERSETMEYVQENRSFCKSFIWFTGEILY